MSNIAIKVDALSKEFKLPHERHGTLKSLILSPFKNKRSFERQRVLEKVSFEVNKGEFFGIVGKNGGGKSTLLKILAQIYDPTKGTIHVDGKLVPFIELGVGFNPELTGRDNVYLNGAMLGFSNKEIDQMYDDIVAFSELEKFMDQKLKNYSSGMQVRLAFSVATRAKADILLVDEVLAVGDASFQRKCYEYFSSLKKDKKTVVFISHDMAAVRQYCDRVLLIDEGEVKKIGKATEIAEEYTHLFETDHDNNDKATTGKEWGNGDITLSAVSAKQTRETITIEASFVPTKDIPDYVVGFSIKAADGAIVWGTNTQLVGIETKSLQANRVSNITFEIENILSDGVYTIDIAVHGYSGLPVYRWVNDAATIRVSYNRTSPYAVYPKLHATLKDS